MSKKAIVIGVVVLALALAAGYGVYSDAKSGCGGSSAACSYTGHVPGGGEGTAQNTMHHGHDMAMGHECPMMDSLATELKLTDEQKERIGEICQTFHGETEPVWNEIKAKRNELVTLLISENTDQTRVSALKKELVDLHAKLVSAAVDRVLEVKGALTPDQRTMAAEKIAEHGTMLLQCGMHAGKGMDGCCARNGAMKASNMPQASKIIDPVCKMEVSDDSKVKAAHDGKTYYFCSESCKAKFMKDPESFLP